MNELEHIFFVLIPSGEEGERLQSFLQSTISGIQIQLVSNLSELWRLTAEASELVVILDWDERGFEDQDFWPEWRQKGQSQGFPLLLISRAGLDEPEKLDLLEQGASVVMSGDTPPEKVLAQIKALWRLRVTSGKGASRPVSGPVRMNPSAGFFARGADHGFPESGDPFRHISANITDMAFSCRKKSDQDFVLDWIFGACFEIFGLSPEKMLKAKCWGKFVIPEDFHLFRQKVLDLEPGTKSVCELRIKTPRHEMRWIEVVAESLPDPVNPEAHVLYGSINEITEKKRIAGELKKLSAATQQSPASIVITNKEGVVEFVNDTFVEVSGYSREEVLGKKPAILQSGMTPGSTYQNLWETLMRGESWVGEFVNRARDGRIYYESARISPLRNEQGEITHYLGTKEDITQKKADQSRIEETTRHFQALIENAPDGVVLVSPAEGFIYASPSALKYFGYSFEELKGFNPEELTHPDDLPEVLASLGRVLGDSTRIETLSYRFRSKFGNWIWIESTFSNLLSEQSVRAIVVNFREITSRKQVELALRESEDRFRALFQASPDAILLSDVESGQILDVNLAAQHLTGRSYTSLLSLTRDDLFAEKYPVSIVDHPDFRDPMTPGSDPSPQAYESRIVQPDGLTIPVEIMDNQIRLQGKLVLQTLCRDITDRKKVDQRLKDLNRKYQKAQEIARIGNWEIHIPTLERKWSDQMFRIFDLDPGTPLSGSLAPPFLPNDTRQIIEEGQMALLEFNKTYRLDYQIILPNGTIRFLHDEGEVVRGESGEPEWLVGTTQDVTESHQAHDKLRRSEEDYRLLFENISQGFALHELVLDEEGQPVDYRFLSANPAFGELTGLEPSRIVGRTVLEIIPEIDKSWIARYGEVALTGKPIRFQEQVPQLGKTYDTLAFSPKPGFFATAFTDISEQERTSSELVESKRSMTTLVNNLPGFSYRCMNNRDWSMIFLSRGCLQVTGYHPEDMMPGGTLTFNDLIHPDYRDFLWQKWQDILAVKGVFEEEYPIIHASGELRWVWEKGCGIFGTEGELMFLEGFIMDISPRKVAEKQLSDSEIRFRKLFESSRDGAIIIESLTGVILEVNSSLCSLTDFSTEDLKSKPFWDSPAFGKIVTSPEEFRALATVFQNPVKSFLTRRNRTEIPVILSGNDYFTSTGRLIHFTFRDISEQEKAENLQKVLYKISHAAITSHDLRELVTIIRSQLGTLLDTRHFFIAFYNEAEDLLTSPFNFDLGDEVESWKASKSLTGLVVKNNAPLLASKKEILALFDQGKIELIGKRAESWLGVPMTVEDKIFGAIVVQSFSNPEAYSASDVEMLSFIAGQIGVAIHRKKTQDDLKAALHKATESDQLKSAFLATMSHEIRTPMNAILGFSDLLNDDMLTAEDRAEFVSIIHRRGNDLLQIINDIIDIAKIDSNQLFLTKSVCDLTLLMRNILHTFEGERKRLEKFNLEIVAEIDPSGPSRILTDENRLAQILRNLVGNSLKFTDQGSIRFGYRLLGDQVLFHVEDTGKGIAARSLEYIFKRFRQENDSHARKFGGTGLGLAISKGLVELLGGRIWVRSEEGVGSTFFFSLPADQLVQVSESTVNGVGDVDENRDMSSKTILVAEDIGLNSELIRLQLRAFNPRILVAENGREAIDLFLMHPEISLILMDIRMPVMDGYEATREIRKINPFIPIIAITAHSFEEDRRKCLEAGCNEFLTKPIDQERLIRSILQYVT